MATNCVDECNQSCIGATWLASNKSVSRHTGRSPFVFVPEIDTPFGKVIDRQFQPNPVAGENTDAVFAHAARCVRRNDRAVFQGNAKPAVREHLIHDAVQFRQFFLCQINFSNQCDAPQSQPRADIRSPTGSGFSANIENAHAWGARTNATCGPHLVRALMCLVIASRWSASSRSI